MSSNHSDLWAGIWAGLSSIGTALAWWWNWGPLQILFSVLTGAAVTYFAQARLEKRKRKQDRQIKMTQQVYGPLLKELNSIRDHFRWFQGVSASSLEHIVDDWMFSLMKEELVLRIKDFQKKLIHYMALWKEAYRETETYILRRLGKHEIKGEITFRISSAGRDEYIISLKEPIFRDMIPLDFLTEKARPYTNPHVIVYVREKSEGTFTNEHRIHQISLNILREVREDSLVQEYRREKEHLLKECQALRESIEKLLVL